MMTYADIRNTLTGSFLLAKRDTSGLQFFDVSIDGFWRSFLVVVPIAPFYVLYAMQEIQIAHEMSGQGTFLVANVGFIAARITLLVLDWFVFPVAMIFIARFLGLWQGYIPFIAIYNWSSLFIILVLAPPALLFYLGVISAQMTATINLFATLFVLYYRWYIAKTVLETAAMTATLIVVFDLVLSLLVHGIFSRLTGY
jgi:hypothetical protein